MTQFPYSNLLPTSKPEPVPTLTTDCRCPPPPIPNPTLNIHCLRSYVSFIVSLKLFSHHFQDLMGWLLKKMAHCTYQHLL